MTESWLLNINESEKRTTEPNTAELKKPAKDHEWKFKPETVLLLHFCHDA